MSEWVVYGLAVLAVLYVIGLTMRVARLEDRDG